jgi:hypothetical protein
VSIVERIITVYNDKGSKQAVKDLKKLEKDFVNAGKKIGKAFGVATVAVGAFAVKVGVDAVKATIDDQKSQVLLANSLRNTVGATDDAIKAVENYITQQQKLFSVADDQLRPSLAALAAATGSITEAQKLQSVALDIAANKQIDLVTASKLLAKAHGGNIGALKKLFPEISANTVKSKDFATALDLVAKASSGAAAAAADTLAGRLEGLKLAYGEILETLGYALLPVIIEFASYIQANVLPALEAWTNANKTKIATSLKNIFDVLQTVIVKLGQFFDFITRNIETLKIFGAILTGIFVSGKIYAGIGALVTAIGLVTTALTAQTTAASTAAVATGFATAGVSLALGAASAILFYNAMKKVTGEVQASTTALGENVTALSHLAELQGKYQVKTIKNTKVLTKEEIAAAKAAKAAAAAAAIIAKQKEASLKAIAALTKLGATPTSETDPIQLEAARLNLVKQANLEELKKVEALMKSAEAQMKVNANAQKYADILLALADNKISPDEIGILAAKWGMTVPAVTNYLAALLIVKDQKIDSTEVELLAAAWGISKEAAEKYLDFYAALNDGTLSDQEIAKLQTKWGLTSKEVLQYADFISKLDDFTLSDEEIKKLQDRWGLTTKEVLAYTKQIGLPVAYNGTLIAPADAAAAGWNKANTALTAYITGLNTAITQSAAANAAAVAAFEATAKAVAGAEAASSAAAKVTTDSAAAAAKITADAAANAAQVTADATAAAAAIAAAAAETAASIVEAAEAAAALADALSGLTQAEKDALAAQTDGNTAAAAATGGSDGVKVNPPSGDLIALASGGIVTSPTMALIGEAGPEAVIPLSRGGGFGGGITINISNAGSVIAEADLVSSIRNALLQAQNNGQVITKSAVAI